MLDDDPPDTGIGFNPAPVAQIGDDMRAAGSYGQVAGKDLRMIEGIDAASGKAARSETISLAQVVCGTVIPPKANGKAHQPRVGISNAAQEH